MQHERRAHVHYLLGVAQRDGKDQSHHSSSRGELADGVMVEAETRSHLSEEDADFVHGDRYLDSLPAGYLDQQLMDCHSSSVLCVCVCGESNVFLKTAYVQYTCICSNKWVLHCFRQSAGGSFEELSTLDNFRKQAVF